MAEDESMKMDDSDAEINRVADSLANAQNDVEKAMNLIDSAKQGISEAKSLLARISTERNRKRKDSASTAAAAAAAAAAITTQVSDTKTTAIWPTETSREWERRFRSSEAAGYCEVMMKYQGLSEKRAKALERTLNDIATLQLSVSTKLGR